MKASSINQLGQLATILARAISRVRAKAVTHGDAPSQDSSASHLELSAHSPLSVSPRGLTPPGEGGLR
jgi:hypothetical protein